MRERRICEIEALESHAEAMLVYNMRGPDSIQVIGIRCAYCGQEYRAQLPALIRHLHDCHGVTP